jgi:hypothetical protein
MTAKKSAPKSKAKAAARASKNFYCVNISQEIQKELHRLCRAQGTTLKDQARWTMLETKERLERMTTGKNDGLPDNAFAGHLKFDLNVSDERALNYFSRKFKGGNQASLAYVGQFILRVALCHPATVSEWFKKLAAYCDAEDLPELIYLTDCVATRREYRRGKVCRL